MKALLISIVLTASVPTKPELRRIRPGAYVAYNPLRVPIKMSIYCAGEYQIVTINLPAGVKEEINITQPNGSPAVCFMDGYQ